MTDSINKIILHKLSILPNAEKIARRVCRRFFVQYDIGARGVRGTKNLKFRSF